METSQKYHLADAEEDFFAYYKLEKKEGKKTEEKKSELPDNYPHCASLTLQSRPRPCASTPATTAAHAHIALTHPLTHLLPQSQPTSLTITLATRQHQSFLALYPSLLRLPAPSPGGAAEKGRKYPRLRRKYGLGRCRHPSKKPPQRTGCR